jgi:dynein heavy chain
MQCAVLCVCLWLSWINQDLPDGLTKQIAERVSEEISLRILFKLPALEASQKIRVAKNVLDSWSETYLEVRERIELGGRDPR